MYLLLTLPRMEVEVFWKILKFCGDKWCHFTLSFSEWSHEFELEVYWYWKPPFEYYNKKWWLSSYVPEALEEKFNEYIKLCKWN